MYSITLLACFSIGWPSTARADSEVEDLGNGFLQLNAKGNRHVNLWYAVDTTTRVCFVTPSNFKVADSFTVVPCESVARRPEWKDIITWIDPEPATE